jgi:23S rRNA (uracil1939-C5)-methyltransferase
VSEAVRILRLASGGDGVGRLADGRTVFVPRTAPGDLVELRGLRTFKRFARARVGQILEPGAGRVEPPCPHYVADECGGCQLQHLEPREQLEARRSFVGEALRRLARLGVPDPEIEPSERVWEYRNKLTLHASADRRRIGLHPLDRPDEVFELQRCPITAAELNELWRAVRRHRRLLPPNLTRLVLRLSRDGGRHLVVRTSEGEVWSEGRALAQAVTADGVPAMVWWQPEGGAPRAVGGAGEAYPATVFEQVHPAMGDRVRAAALAALGSVAGRHVWDLYAGIGETTDRLADAGATVESVEWDGRAVAEGERRMGGTPSAGRVERIAARVEDAIGGLRPADLVVTNPPRTGMDERVTAALGRRPAARIVYISCDPATLARDIARLAGTHRLASARAFDLFPQTAHVETVAVLDRVDPLAAEPIA